MSYHSNTEMNLWSGTPFAVSSATWSVNLGARQAKLFRLGSGSISATGPTNQSVLLGNSTALTTVASATPPFNYVWKKNGVILAGKTANTIAINPMSAGDAANYTVEVNSGSGNVTNSAVISILPLSLTPTIITVQLSNGNFTLKWRADHTGWWLQSQTSALAAPGVSGLMFNILRRTDLKDVGCAS